MFGRDHDINSAVNALLLTPESYDYSLQDSAARISILGPGGIGKTTLALSIMHHELVCSKFDEERVFISCEAAATVDLLLAELAVSLRIATEKVEDDLLQVIINRLKKKPTLLVLDNFETIWDAPLNRTDVESVLSEITSIASLALILTMRGSQRPAGMRWSNVISPLQPVDLESARSIFRSIAHEVDEHATFLIQAVDRVPLAVTLIANLASVQGETTEALWTRWKAENISMVQNGQDRLSSMETSVRLSLSSPRMQRDPDALPFLSVLALLPDGMSPTTLRSCEAGLPTVTSTKKAISTLRQNALVYDDADGILRVLSPIRLFVQAHYPPSHEARHFLYDNFIHLALQGSWYHDGAIRSQMGREAANINAILVDTLSKSANKPLEEIIEATLNFCRYTYASGVGSSNILAVAVERLQALDTLGPSSKAPSEDQDRRRGFRRLQLFQMKPGKGRTMAAIDVVAPNADPMLKLRADCLGTWGQMLCRQSQFGLAEEKFNLAKDLHSMIGDVVGQAYDTLNLGILYSREMLKYDEALLAFQDAIRLHEAVGDLKGKGYDLLGAGYVHQARLKFDEAQDTFSSAAALFLEMKDDSGRTSALIGLAATMQSLYRYSEAERLYSEALKISTSLGDIVSEAEIQAGLSVAFLLRSQFDNAQAAIERAISLRSPSPEAGLLHILGRVYVAKANYDQAHAILTHTLSLREDAGDHLGQADDLYYLACIAFYRGNVFATRELIDRAVEKLESAPNLLSDADLIVLNAMVWIRYCDLDAAKYGLISALEIYTQACCALGQAACLYHLGVFHLRNAANETALENFTAALHLHTRAGNLQGQADDKNKIGETLLRQGFLQEGLSIIFEAYALHIQIEDLSGQGDDLYILSTIFLAQGRLGDSENAIRNAMELHKQSESKYGEGRDLATLSDIFLHKNQNLDTVDLDEGENASVVLKQAMDMFSLVNAVAEYFHCQRLLCRMEGKNPGDSVPYTPKNLLYWDEDDVLYPLPRPKSQK
ncbi:hypothetical protein B0H34DRAFT_334467 [Crassisporium funariophilum]|nr:hypothetical protein B0H34DRAFT_334467 [Crassisporium funariophilum]